MKELPNWNDRRHATLTEPEVKEIVESWRSGQLVDSEAIDHKALALDIWRYYLYSDGPGDIIYNDGDHRTAVMDALAVAIDAAIEPTV